jgi:hypothetical protein
MQYTYKKVTFDQYDLAKLDEPENKNANTGQASAIVYVIGPQ